MPTRIALHRRGLRGLAITLVGAAAIAACSGGGDDPLAGSASTTDAPSTTFELELPEIETPESTDIQSRFDAAADRNVARQAVLTLDDLPDSWQPGNDERITDAWPGEFARCAGAPDVGVDPNDDDEIVGASSGSLTEPDANWTLKTVVFVHETVFDATQAFDALGSDAAGACAEKAVQSSMKLATAADPFGLEDVTIERTDASERVEFRLDATLRQGDGTAPVHAVYAYERVGRATVLTFASWSRRPLPDAYREQSRAMVTDTIGAWLDNDSISAGATDVFRRDQRRRALEPLLVSTDLSDAWQPSDESDDGTSSVEELVACTGATINPDTTITARGDEMENADGSATLSSRTWTFETSDPAVAFLDSLLSPAAEGCLESTLRAAAADPAVALSIDQLTIERLPLHDILGGSTTQFDVEFVISDGTDSAAVSTKLGFAQVGPTVLYLTAQQLGAPVDQAVFDSLLTQLTDRINPF